MTVSYLCFGRPLEVKELEKRRRQLDRQRAGWHGDNCLSCWLHAGYTSITTFATTPGVSIEPKTGMGLLFQHPIIHDGSVVTAGTKYVARTDLICRKMGGRHQ